VHQPSTLLPRTAHLPALSGDRHDFNVVARFERATGWLHGTMSWFATYGVVLLAVALVIGWWLGRRESSSKRVATAVWGAIAAVIALGIGQAISSAVNEKRPFVAIPGVHPLIHHAADAGFPSDHATAAGAVAVALLFVSWRLGLSAVVIALVIAFSRVYVGIHFPQDVAAGLALGGCVALVGIAVVVPLMSRIVRWLGGTPLRPLVAAAPAQVRVDPSTR
jgi:membrane-associated phospholipid phosphatase